MTMNRLQWVSLGLLVALVGCSGAVLGEFQRLDSGGTFDVFRPPDVGGMVMTTVELRERGRIRRIVVDPRVTLQKFEVRVRTALGTWETVKTLTGRHASPVTVTTDLEGDAVRVVETSPALRTRAASHVAGTSPSIKAIVVYGTRIESNPAPTSSVAPRRP